MWHFFVKELHYLRRHRADLLMVTLAPLMLIVIFSSMLAAGKPEHLPIALLDEDQSVLSRKIESNLNATSSVNIRYHVSNQSEIETLLNQTKIWGYVHIPHGAQVRMVRGEDAQISVAYNQSFYSIGNTISSAMLNATVDAITNYIKEQHLRQIIPYADIATPNVKISMLYNPALSYEFYLAPFLVPAVLHLLLCCCVAYAVGREANQSISDWVTPHNFIQGLLAKNLFYILIFCFWTWLWMIWMVVFRGWFIAGSVVMLISAQVLLYAAYAFITSTVVLLSMDLERSFGVIAVYGGSSLSFAGVTLPLNNAPLFTQIWGWIIPYTPYARLQTEQWAIGSDISVSSKYLLILIGYSLSYLFLSSLLLKLQLKKSIQKVSS